MFVGAHAMLAIYTKSPELVISDQDGVAFMKAAQKVMSHYSVETSQKTLDWIALMGTMGTIYLPRGVAIWARHQGERMNRPPAPAPAPAHAEGPKPNGRDPTFVPSVPQEFHGESFDEQ